MSRRELNKLDDVADGRVSPTTKPAQEGNFKKFIHQGWVRIVAKPGAKPGSDTHYIPELTSKGKKVVEESQ